MVRICLSLNDCFLIAFHQFCVKFSLPVSTHPCRFYLSVICWMKLNMQRTHLVHLTYILNRECEKVTSAIHWYISDFRLTNWLETREMVWTVNYFVWFTHIVVFQFWSSFRDFANYFYFFDPFTCDMAKSMFVSS